MKHVNEGIIIIDKSENIVNYNNKALTLLKVGDFKIGRHIFKAAENTENIIGIKKLLKKDQKNSSINIEAEKFKYLLRITITKIENDKGRTEGKIIRIKKQSLGKKFRKLREGFVANVSHELKTPLTVVKGSVETLLNGALHNREDAEHFLKVISKHTDRLHTLINDILNLSSIEKNLEKKDLELEKYNIKKLIDNVIAMYRNAIEEKGIELVVNCMDEVEINVNVQLIELAISNLVDNAVKYNRQENGFIRIKVETLDEKVLISVKDSGIGIEKEYIPRLFERFFRVDKIKSRRIGGTGLGLSIVKQIVKAHKGLITIKSEPQIGSNFTIALPLKLKNK